MTPAERDQCISLWEGGATLDALCEVFDRERSTISRLVQRRSAQKGRYGQFANREPLTNRT